jgi:hypothetical protein
VEDGGSSAGVVLPPFSRTSRRSLTRCKAMRMLLRRAGSGLTVSRYDE